MFENEISRGLVEVKVVWYPKEELCLVFKGKLIRRYKKIPKKYIVLFDKKRG